MIDTAAKALDLNNAKLTRAAALLTMIAAGLILIAQYVDIFSLKSDMSIVKLVLLSWAITSPIYFLIFPVVSKYKSLVFVADALREEIIVERKGEKNLSLLEAKVSKWIRNPDTQSIEVSLTTTTASYTNLTLYSIILINVFLEPSIILNIHAAFLLYLCLFFGHKIARDLLLKKHKELQKIKAKIKAPIS